MKLPGRWIPLPIVMVYLLEAKRVENVKYREKLR